MDVQKIVGVVNRAGQYRPMKFDKIASRVTKLGLGLMVDPALVVMDTVKYMHDGIKTQEIDQISAKVADSLKLKHPDYAVLASCVLASNLHKSTPQKFSTCCDLMHAGGMISDYYYKFIAGHAEVLDGMIIDKNDYQYDYIGYKTLVASYLNKVNVGSVEVLCDRPQYMYMRTAISVNYKGKGGEDVVKKIRESYELMSGIYYTHASPTYYNACSKNQQLNSCFVMGTEDNIENIMWTVRNASIVSKWSGGISVHMSNVRSCGSSIKGTRGKSKGIVPQIRFYEDAMMAWDQGGKRPGACAIYVELWHGDLMEFLELKLNNGDENMRIRDLFYGIMVPDLFMERLVEDGDWSLFSSADADGLSDVYDGMEICGKCGYCANIGYMRLMYGHAADKMLPEENGPVQQACGHVFEKRKIFTELYVSYEKSGLATKKVKATKIMDAICAAKRASGVPYVVFKDHVNRCSSQKNIGTIKSSNLCTEIYEYSSSSSYASCTLASVNVRKFLQNGEVDHAKLHEVVRLIVRNLDSIIDVNVYPVQECVENAKNYRPIGIGIQGLADMFMEQRVAFLSGQAERDDIAIAETIYHAALTESMALAGECGSYVGFVGSPAHRGKLQFHLWEENTGRKAVMSGRYDWPKLVEKIREHGLRHSVMVAYMPTVSTSQITGNNESFEPIHSNIYTKTMLFGKSIRVNKLMVKHLMELGLWDDKMKDEIVEADGSLQRIERIPPDVRKVYKTVWEMRQSELMGRAALRSAFIDQGQSMNVYLRNNSNAVMRGVFIHGWKLGLKTGSYYIRTAPAAKAMKNSNGGVCGSCSA